MGSKRRGSSGKRAPGMRRPHTQVAERWAVRHIAGVVEDNLGWHFGDQPLPDYGVDALAEIVASDDLVTGRLLGLQIKGGDSYFKPKGSKGWTFSDSNDHLAYWLGHSLPVIVVLVDSERRAYWQAITTRTVKENKKGFSVLVPRNQPFDESAREALVALAGRREGLLEHLPSYYSVLPPGAASALRQAEPVDQLATARLAERLADGRGTAGMTAAAIIAAQPSWLTESAVAEDLWRAVAVYASQHNCFTEAGKAFGHAADCEGSQTARSLAEAGLAFIWSDRQVARLYLDRAREKGQLLLAEVGLSLLAIPEGHGTPPEIPEELNVASSEELQAEPVALMFLSDAASRREDLTKAVEYAERAVKCASDRDTVTRFHLAQSIHRRALAEAMASSEFRRALSYTLEVIEERRRWDGPSAEALAFLLDIYIGMDMAAAVTAALPLSEGGTAHDGEASSPEVARRGAFAALASQNEAAYRFFMDQLPDGAQRRELLVMEADANGRPVAERVSERIALLEDTTDDTMVARNVAALVKLGVWPDQADQLRDRSLLPADTYEMLKAIYRTRSGDAAVGIAKLRELATGSTHAALELIDVLEEVEGPDSAIEEASHQVARKPVPGLTLKLLDLLGKHRRDEQAAEMIERTITDGSLPNDARLKLANWYVARKGRERKFTEAAAFAARSLEIGPDPDLSWALVKSLQNDGRVAAARDALARHRPEPIRDDEMHLWMQLHLGIPLSPDDAPTMIDIVHRQPDGQFRDAIIGLLVREVLLTATEAGNHFPAEVVEAVRQLQQQAENRPGNTIQLAAGDEESLKLALSSTQPDLEQHAIMVANAQAGRESVAEIARFVGRPYAVALLQRPAGIIPAIDLAPGLRRAGETAAGEAIDGGRCVVDLSSLHLLNLIDEDDRLRIRGTVRKFVVARSSVGDATLTRDQMRGLTMASHVAVLNSEGAVDRVTLTPMQQAALREQSEALETLAESCEVQSLDTHRDAAADTIALAKQSGLPLWCDDTALRQKARHVGVSAFSFLDLITTIRQRDHKLNEAAIFQHLANEYVMDLPLSGDDIIHIAAATQWKRGPVHAVLARPDWWRHTGESWADTWLSIATEARRRSTEVLVDITRSAIIGSMTHVGAAHGAGRYQRLVTLALVACRNVEEQAVDNILLELANFDGVDPRLAPNPQNVLANLIAELQARHIENAVEVAHRMLPSIDLI